MADAITLNAEPRTARGKKVQQLRREGLIPIVVYGPRSEPIALQTLASDLTKVLSQAGGTTLIAIDVKGEAAPRMTLAKEVQRHVTRLVPVHADFIEVVMNEPITKNVPLRLIGEPEIVRRNLGYLAMDLDRLPVRALPALLPQVIDVDVEGMNEIGDTLYLRDLDAGPDVEILGDPDSMVVRIEPPRMQEAEEEPEDEELELAEEGEAGEADEAGPDTSDGAGDGAEKAE